MPRHHQVMVKVNAPVDQGIAETVSLLSQVPGLETIESCEGNPGHAFVLFYLGEWEDISRFLFEKIARTLMPLVDGIEVSVEIFNQSRPRGRLAFDPGVTSVVVRTLKEIL